jgi:hypothetical protein
MQANTAKGVVIGHMYLQKDRPFNPKLITSASTSIPENHMAKVYGVSL